MGADRARGAAVTARNTAAQIREAAVDLAIVPIGSVEQHAAHLPIGTDLFTVETIAAAVAERLACYLLPAVPFSAAFEHLGVPGTIAIRGETLVAYVRDVVDSLARHGVTHVCLLSGHGGNFILRPAVRELNLREGGPRVILAWTWMGAEAKFSAAESDDKHAGEWETSIMLEIDEPAVQRPFAADSVPSLDFEFSDYVPWELVTGNGVWGRPSLANRTKGRQYLDAAVDFLVDYVPRTFAEVDRLWGTAATRRLST
jgi:creatinine amidohydrolase